MAMARRMLCCVPSCCIFPFSFFFVSACCLRHVVTQHFVPLAVCLASLCAEATKIYTKTAKMTIPSGWRCSGQLVRNLHSNTSLQRRRGAFAVHQCSHRGVVTCPPRTGRAMSGSPTSGDFAVFAIPKIPVRRVPASSQGLQGPLQRSSRENMWELARAPRRRPAPAEASQPRESVRAKHFPFSAGGAFLAS